MENKAYEYCKSNIDLKTTPKYVKKQMREFMRICEDKDKNYVISKRKYTQVSNILKLLRMPKGLKAGLSLYECTMGYQWLVYIAVLCVVHRDNPKKRKYETCVLEICRKNFKTYTAGAIFILLFLTEPKYSKFYSVAADGSLSKEVKEAISETLRSSPAIYEWKGNKRFKILRDYILFKPLESKFIPLSYSTSRMDGRLPNAFIADEVGALPVSYPIDAMRSGQLNILNKLGIIISTKYPTVDNPLEDEVAYSKRVLDGLEDDPTRFALLYEPDNPKDWQTDDLIMQQSNPVALEITEIWEDLLKKRAYAIAVESARQNFLTKHCNIIYQGLGTETYIDINDVKKCKVDKINWYGRNVFVGVDLSMTNDNTSVSFVSFDNGKLLANSFAFIPDGRIDEKSVNEKIDYRMHMRKGHVFACGDMTIDYEYVENFVFNLEKLFGVNVIAIGYDRYNCMSSAQKWSEKYETVEIKQHSSVLHPATKFLKEKIENGDFEYEENDMLEINFQNAKCTYDTNMNMYVNKKKSSGKIDMVVSLINAVFLENEDILAHGNGFVAQII